MSVYLLLEDGLRFDGDACGAEGTALGEVVFTTSMSGYQEAVSDPSFRGQLITFTYPHIGNYGVCAAHMESDRIHARGAIMRAATNDEDAPSAEGGWLDWLADCGIPGITGIDTRALVRHLRDKGAMRGGIFPASVAEEDARTQIEAEPPMRGRDLAQEVTPQEPVILHPHEPTENATRIVALDTGIKTSIVENFRKRGAVVELHPCTASADSLRERNADAYFLANGPGDPAALDYVVATVRELAGGTTPIYGICLGHQLLCRAVGLETYKLPFGHRGANHPVKDLETGVIAITSQNHGFAVRPPGGADRLGTDEGMTWETDFGRATLTHVNLYDGTVEGLRLHDLPGRTVQHHPEAGPGPNDAVSLFDDFLEEIRAAS